MDNDHAAPFEKPSIRHEVNDGMERTS